MAHISSDVWLLTLNYLINIFFEDLNFQSSQHYALNILKVILHPKMKIHFTHPPSQIPVRSDAQAQKTFTARLHNAS